jgi:hypothetical protein
MRAALYARVSTGEQTCENWLLESPSLRRGARVGASRLRGPGHQRREGSPAGTRGTGRGRSPQAVRPLVWRRDRLGRALILRLDELSALGISFVSLGEGFDTSKPTPASHIRRSELHHLA